MLANLDYFKEFLGIKATNVTQDARLQIYLDQADAAIKAAIGRDLESTSYPGAATGGTGDSGFYNGTGTRHLLLKQCPVSSATTPRVWLDPTGRFGVNPDGSFATATELVYGTDFVLLLDGCLPGTSTKCSYCGILERVGGVWPGRTQYIRGEITLQPAPGQGNIKVSYTAGYPTVPHDLRAACVELAAYIRRSAPQGGPVMSESLGGYSYSIGGTTGGPPELGTVRSLIARYREVSW